MVPAAAGREGEQGGSPRGRTKVTGSGGGDLGRGGPTRARRAARGEAAMWARLPTWHAVISPGEAADVSGASGRCPARGEEGDLGFRGRRPVNFGGGFYI